MNRKWYVLRSKPNKEMILWRELIARGAECFFPRLYVRPADPRSRKVRPYFPGYLFLKADLEQVGLSAYQWMPFSGGLLAFDGIPAIVPPNLIEAIRQRVEAINTRGVEQSRAAGLEQGESVVIQGGPFEGHQAIFDALLPGRERVRVLIRLLQSRTWPLELPAAQVVRKPR